MKHQISTIFSFVKRLNNEYWLPAIQRDFVWKEQQICKLFDSVMREYPFGTFLVWETKMQIRKRTFQKHWSKNIGTKDSFLPSDDHQKKLIIDGQQRLQSFHIGLLGTFNNKSLHFDILSCENEQKENELTENLYGFEFKDKNKNDKWNWVCLLDIFESEEKSTKILTKLEQKLNQDGFRKNRDLILENIVQLIKVFKTDEIVSYQVLENIENSSKYSDNAVVEIFVRANSGGTKLEKSELLFALLTSKWDDASQKLNELESDLAECGFEFTRDYFLKAVLILLGKKAAYDIKKFRDPATLEALKSEWLKIASAIKDVVDFLPIRTPIGNSKALASKNSLLPLIAFRFANPSSWKSEDSQNIASQYLIRTIICGTFSGAKDDLLDELASLLTKEKEINLAHLLGKISAKGRSVTIDKVQLLSMQYKNNKMMLVMKLLHPEMRFIASNKNNLPTIDHLFSKKILRQKDVKVSEINQLANLAPLTADQNRSKSAKSLEQWLGEMSSVDQNKVCNDLLIPTDKKLWNPDSFGDFITERKKLILQAAGIKEILGDGDLEDVVNDDSDE